MTMLARLSTLAALTASAVLVTVGAGALVIGPVGTWADTEGELFFVVVVVAGTATLATLVTVGLCVAAARTAPPPSAPASTRRDWVLLDADAPHPAAVRAPRQVERLPVERQK